MTFGATLKAGKRTSKIADLFISVPLVGSLARGLTFMETMPKKWSDGFIPEATPIAWRLNFAWLPRVFDKIISADAGDVSRIDIVGVFFS